MAAMSVNGERRHANAHGIVFRQLVDEANQLRRSAAGHECRSWYLPTVAPERIGGQRGMEEVIHRRDRNEVKLSVGRYLARPAHVEGLTVILIDTVPRILHGRKGRHRLGHGRETASGQELHHKRNRDRGPRQTPAARRPHPRRTQTKHRGSSSHNSPFHQLTPSEFPVRGNPLFGRSVIWSFHNSCNTLAKEKGMPRQQNNKKYFNISNVFYIFRIYL